MAAHLQKDAFIESFVLRNVPIRLEMLKLHVYSRVSCLVFIQAVPELNFGLDTDHPERLFVDFLGPFGKFQDSTSS
jgi:hypothetical protein